MPQHVWLAFSSEIFFPFRRAWVLIIIESQRATVHESQRETVHESQRETVHESQRETVQDSTCKVRVDIKCVQKLTTNLNIWKAHLGSLLGKGSITRVTENFR